MKKFVYHSIPEPDKGTEFLVHFDDDAPGGCIVQARIDGKLKQNHAITKMFVRELLEKQSHDEQQRIIQALKS